MNRLLVLASAVLACAMPAEDNTSAPPPPPPSLGGQDTIRIAGHALYVPRGFTVNLFVEGLNGVRYLALGPGGAVYASLPGAGQIVRLVDVNGDGVADAPAQAVLGGLNAPFGIAFRGDTMYFAEQTAVKRLDPGATTPLTLVSGLPSGGHATRTLVIGPRQLHVCCGRLVVQRVRRAGGRLDARGGHALQPGRVRRTHLRPGAPQLGGPRLSPDHR